MPVAALLLAMTVFVAGTQTGADGISAYLTYRTVDLDNNTTIALDTITTVIEKYPDPVPKLDGTVASYEKAVQFGNIGFIDAYVRAKIEFTEADIESKTKFSWDGVNYYSVSEYKNHLPDGWVYHDGYYYYTPILAAGDWDTISADLIWDEDLGEYFYHENDELKVCDEITVPLIRYVKTTFDNVKDLRTYELSVSEESVPFYFGDDYMSAWTAYIEGMGDPVMQ
jgi:hypothetical protein